eukprot:TRINITY_DN27674_c0_g1_i1.p1 TRINITY_DN27674_c0_g1~~TRINITY_DN27674_c0_g1_i1.p1  ORF type:complete len:963 (+),score=288.93 TRINITY_DN27674_c0_g1_i1:131-3019(+)
MNNPQPPLPGQHSDVLRDESPTDPFRTQSSTVSLTVDPEQLLNNDVAEAMLKQNSEEGDEFQAQLHHVLDKPGVGGTTAFERNAVDFTKPQHKQRLRDACRLIRTLFWAFEDVELQDDGTPGHEDRPSRGFRARVARVVQHEAFTTFFMLLTFYALFGPDIAMSMGHTAQNPKNASLAILNTFVLFLFAMEEVLQCIAFPDYICSGRFWIDTFATMSIIGDSWIGLELVQSDAAVAGRSSRLIRLVRIGGRSGRLVRMLRIARLTQILRLIPKLQQWMERSTQELALLLWHKRIWHVFQFLDSRGTGCMTDSDLDFFQVAMMLSFPGKDEMTTPKWNMSDLTTKVQMVVNSSVVKLRQGSTAGDTRISDGTFKNLTREFVTTPVGKRAYLRCIEDINCMKESCAIVERAVGRLTLKVCVLVLMLLVAMQLLGGSTDDISVPQGLKQLELMKNDPAVTPEVLCSMIVEEYSQISPSKKLDVLVLQNKLLWIPGCHCCNPAQAATIEFPVDYVEDYLQASPMEPHEFLVQSIETSGSTSSAVVFDVHVEMRDYALASFTHTVVVVVLLLVLVVYFATDMKRLSNSNVLHPLWVLMDDMCALKSIEVMTEKNSMEDDTVMPLLSYKATGRMSKFETMCSKFKFKMRQRIPVADELLQLRNAFKTLHTAMLSWSKYVPVILLKQLFEAGVEAKIGCATSEVSIFFCDIDGFREICQDKKPYDVLAMLEEVLTGIHLAIEEHGGTLLEFIGDEVLAVFNAPLKVNEHSKAAVLAALEAQERSSKAMQTGVRLQCGVHKANVLCGNIGSPTRMKYGCLGDGVNLTARLKSLNTRFGTGLLVSADTLKDVIFSEQLQETIVTRPIGHLILKGRSTPTTTIEVLGKQHSCQSRIMQGAERYRRAFDLYVKRSFGEAKALFEEANALLSNRDGRNLEDRPSAHHIKLCQQYIVSPPPTSWDGSEHLTKKAW